MDKIAFEARLRRTLGQATRLFDSGDLQDYRDAEIEQLEDKYIRRYVTDSTNRAGESVFYPLPTSFSKVRRIEFWDYDPESNVGAIMHGTSQGWNDRERDGYIRIGDGPLYKGDTIYMIGEGPYTDISQCFKTVADVVLYGAAIRALESQIMTRAFTRASQAASRRSDVTLASMGMLLARLDTIYKAKVSRARKSVAVLHQ